MRLSNRYGERVEFVEKNALAVAWIGYKGLAGELNQRFISPAVATRGGNEEPVALNHAAKIFICDRDRMVKGIELDGVCSFESDAGESQKPESKRLRLDRGKHAERAGELCIEHLDKGFQRRGLASEEAGRTNEVL